MNTTRDALGTFRRRLRREPWRFAGPLMVACLALLLLSSELAGASFANTDTTVRIDPSSQQVILDHTATTNVLIEDVNDLYGYEFQITFDPTLVEVVDASPSASGVQIQLGDFLSPDWVLENAADNEEGTIALALSQQDPSPPKDGSGSLATITWRGSAVGTSPITITYVLLSAPRGVSIPATTQSGQITVDGAFPVPVLTGLSPVSTTVGAPAFNLTVRGASFVSSSAVHWDGAARPTTFISSTRLTAQIAPTDLVAPGTISVTVVNPTPGGGTSNTRSFSVERAPETDWAIFLPLVVRGEP